MLTKRISLAVLLALASTGCGPTSQSYDVAVRNSTASPLTVWLTKRGGPVESNWLSPEQVAIRGAGKDNTIPGILIQPGDARGTGIVKGKFDADSRAMLRVYRGQLTLDEMLATSHADGSSRLDITLEPGLNHYVITEDAGTLKATRSERFKRAAATRPATGAAALRP